MLIPALSLLALGAVVVVIIMTLVWLISRRLRNAGIVDIAWSANFAVLALLYASFGSGDTLRRWTFTAMTVLWSLRLASHLWRRVVGHIEVEDSRYAKLRADWGSHAETKMFWFFQFQGLTNLALSVPALLVAISDRSGILHPLELTGMLVWLIALCGESLADSQLRRFRSDPAMKSGVCDTGLWRYSRHPNYFFEWLIWCGFFLFTLGGNHGWIAAYCPLLMFWFLYKVTGIPMTEEQSVKHRGDAYRRYQKVTSPFFPWFPKHGGSN